MTPEDRSPHGDAGPASEDQGAASPPLLSVRDLGVHFPEADGRVARAVDGVSFDLTAGETLALVGESGCGKSLTALSLVRLVDEPPARTVPGSSIRFVGEELVGADPARLRRLRGGEVGFVFQEPMTALNPVHRVGRQIEEAILAHEPVARREARERSVGLLERVGLTEPDRTARSYPHELSGGMRQRALIAMAISCDPQLLIADEPTTALDVTVQAQILELLAALREERDMGMLLISHDLAVVANVADGVAVMYGGRIMEMGSAGQVLTAPGHPYAEGLLRSVPMLDRPRGPLAIIPGMVPSPAEWPTGCRFHPRCPYAWDRCASDEPTLDRDVRCWLVDEPDRRGARGYVETR